MENTIKQTVPLTPDDDIIKWQGCPDCKGRGWFLINPFANSSAASSSLYSGNMAQCPTCKETHAYYKKHGCLPVEVA